MYDAQNRTIRGVPRHYMEKLATPSRDSSLRIADALQKAAKRQAEEVAREDSDKAGLLPQGMFDWLVGGDNNRDKKPQAKDVSYEPLPKEIVDYFGFSQAKALDSADFDMKRAVKLQSEYAMNNAAESMMVAEKVIDKLLQSVDAADKAISETLAAWWAQAQEAFMVLATGETAKDLRKTADLLEELGELDAAELLDDIEDGVVEKSLDQDRKLLRRARRNLLRSGYEADAGILTELLEEFNNPAETLEKSSAAERERYVRNRLRVE